MRKQFKKKQDEFVEKLKKQDEELLELIKQGPRDIIIQVIKDYLSLLE